MSSWLARKSGLVKVIRKVISLFINGGGFRMMGSALGLSVANFKSNDGMLSVSREPKIETRLNLEARHEKSASPGVAGESVPVSDVS